jgi:hypothetical protein
LLIFKAAILSFFANIKIALALTENAIDRRIVRDEATQLLDAT